MFISNETNNRIPQHVRKKARMILMCVESGQVKPIKLKHHRSDGDLFKVELFFNWRMISSDLDAFTILSHETYNRLFK
jgi:hypothetical protein